jgi:cytochrome c551/c552
MRARALVLAGLVFALAGCGGEETVSPRPATVQGTVPTAQTATSSPGGGGSTTVSGSTTKSATTTSGGGGGGGGAGGAGGNGKALFTSNGCNSCHAYKPAGSNAKIGPDLDNLAKYARQAKQPLEAFTRESIVNPKAYVQPGYQPVMPSFSSLSKDQVDALVAFLTKKS